MVHLGTWGTTSKYKPEDSLMFSGKQLMLTAHMLAAPKRGQHQQYVFWVLLVGRKS